MQHESLFKYKAEDLEKSYCKTHVCDKCNRQFKQKTRYDRHVANHPSEKNYLCSTCNKTFTRMAHLEKHLQTHTNERRHVCLICGAAFILSHHLVRHNLVHTGIRPFECEICKKKFTRKAGLTQHMYIHNGERPFHCDIENCGKSFSDKTTLRRHFLTHFCEKPFICKECEKTFKTKSACRKHYVKHFIPNSSFKCGICEEMFKTKDLLAKHTTMHDLKEMNKNFRCGFCMRVFKSQVDLELHVPQHDSGLLYECFCCHLKFFSKSDLDNHIIQQSHYLQNDSSKNKSDVSNNEVVIVLQLPCGNSKVDIKDDTLQILKDNRDMQINDIHHLINNTKLDKLLVNSPPNPSFTLQLSEDQQQSMQDILHNVNVQYLITPPSSNNLASIHHIFSDDQLEHKVVDGKDNDFKSPIQIIEKKNSNRLNKNDSVFRSSKTFIEPHSHILFGDTEERIEIMESGKFIAMDLIDTSFEKLPKSFQHPFDDIESSVDSRT
ncbi:zinc finger protein 320 isoform X3 [Hydra vulgaris]